MIKSRLKVLLAERDISQTQLAKEVGIVQPTINEIANNKAKQSTFQLLQWISCAAILTARWVIYGNISRMTQSNTACHVFGFSCSLGENRI